jgi:putative thiamine transport system ATP-binding protein
MPDVATPPSPGLSLRCVQISLAARLLVDLSLDVAPGQIVTLMGPSGSGKSTFLNYLCGTLDPAFAARGIVLLNQRRIDGLPPERRHLGILFQDDLLFPHLSVAGNLGFALTRKWRGRAKRRAKIEEALASAGLEGLADHDPARLSGGQRARISLLRILLAEPAALLLDEPFAKLDLPLRERFRQTVFAIIRDRQLPTIMVTHETDDAAAAAGRIITLGGPSTSPIPHRPN